MVLGVCTIFNKAFLYKQGNRIWLGAFSFQPTPPSPAALMVTKSRVPCVN